jgi:hypothetical protein
VMLYLSIACVSSTFREHMLDYEEHVVSQNC